MFVVICFRYTIHISGYSGDAGDGFITNETTRNINGMKFTTYDVTNDHLQVNNINCATNNGGGWWYNACAIGEPHGSASISPGHFRWKTTMLNGGDAKHLQMIRMMIKKSQI